MKKFKSQKIIHTAILMVTVGLVGCATVNANAHNDKKKSDDNSNVMCVEQAQSTINVDGILDEPVWKNAKAYKLYRAANREKGGETVAQSGEVKLARDTNYFYVGITFNDLDVIAEGKENQLKHYKFGDICEVILTPENKTWYWEMYATPAGKNSCFFIPGTARVGLPSMMEYQSELKVASKVNGTLNDWRDKDVSWTAEMAMPIKELTAHGEKFNAEGKWKILVARYNFGRYLKTEGAELSMTPQLSHENFHLLPEFASLKFIE
ncbi:MAG: hypothetical protein DRI44_02900 [Chlamydiae bacterium]|nr:MAG: hypothetical protein DRI44_02900 [Chlamydiota bacterium]